MTTIVPMIVPHSNVVTIKCVNAVKMLKRGYDTLRTFRISYY